MNFELLTGLQLDQELHSADSTQLFTTARRNAAINEGMQEFVDLTECLVRESSIVCSCNTQEYNLLGSTDFVRLASRGPEYRITSSGSSGVTRILAGEDDFPNRSVQWRNIYDAGWRASTVCTTPTGWYLRDDDGALYIGLDHPPRIGSSETAVLVVPYIPLLPPMTSTGEEPFSVGGIARLDLRPYHKATVHYGAHNLEKLRADTEASDSQYQKFLAYVERWKSAMRKKAGQYIRTGRSYLREASRRRGDDGDRRWTQWP